MAGFDHLKSAMRDQRRAEARAKREQRRRWRRCFWTRPYGHEYVLDRVSEDTTVKRCVSCAKPYDD